MSKPIALILLWSSPVIITLACAACGVFLGFIRNGFGPSRSSGPIVLASLLLWLLHAGYLLGPWLWSHQRPILAIALMMPVAVFVILMIIVFGGRLASNPTGPRGEDNHMGLFFAVLIAALVVYSGPIIAMLAARPAASAVP